MPQKQLTIKVDTPIASVNVVDKETEEQIDELQKEKEALQQQVEHLSQVCTALEKAAEELKNYYKDIFSTHKEQICRLSIEIAKKILLKDIEKGDYDIKKIIQEALKKAPTQQDVIIRLNPADLTHYRKSVEGKEIDILSEVQLVPDTNIGPAECVIETKKGMIEYFIDKHIEQISEALKGVS